MAHYDVLKIISTSVSLEQISLNHVIITSWNAVDFLKQHHNQVKQLYVVGEKTAQRLADSGFKIQVIAHNASALSQLIIEDYSTKDFTYICGVHRRDELPQALLSTQINFTEVKVYDSIAVEKSFDCIFDAVMFFSPRGVHAFAKANPQNLHLAICIGETTATAARMYTQNVKVAHKTTVENTIVTAVKALRND